MSTLEGIDISHWQDGLDLSKYKGDFVIMKATESTTYVDPKCDKFYQKAKSLGFKLGVYHFWNSGSAKAQAEHFVDTVKGYIGDAILVLDWESRDTSDVSSAKAWLDHVYKLTGVRPLIYMSGSVANKNNWKPVVDADYALWLARWGSSSPGATGAWPSAAIWQYTSDGNVPGYKGRVDLDVFYGTRSAWDAYAGKSSSKPSTSKLDTDGKWGSKTTTSLQTSFAGLTVDGEVWDQPAKHKDIMSGCTSGWKWENNPAKGGSPLIRAMMAVMKDDKQYNGEIDGWAGPEFAKALQRRYNTSVDGELWNPSPAIKAMQEKLNKYGTF